MYNRASLSWLDLWVQAERDGSQWSRISSFIKQTLTVWHWRILQTFELIIIKYNNCLMHMIHKEDIEVGCLSQLSKGTLLFVLFFCIGHKILSSEQHFTKIYHYSYHTARAFLQTCLGNIQTSQKQRVEATRQSRHLAVMIWLRYIDVMINHCIITK